MYPLVALSLVIFECNKNWTLTTLNFQKSDKNKPHLDTKNYFKWKSHEYKNWTTHQHLILLYRPFFHMTKWLKLCSQILLISLIVNHFVIWKNGLYKSIRCWWVVQFLYSWLCHLELLSTSNLSFKFKIFQIQSLNSLNKVNWKNVRNTNGRSRCAEQLCFLPFFQFESFSTPKMYLIS